MMTCFIFLTKSVEENTDLMSLTNKFSRLNMKTYLCYVHIG